jgi:hypothetical protein
MQIVENDRRNHVGAGAQRYDPRSARGGKRVVQSHREREMTEAKARFTSNLSADDIVAKADIVPLPSSEILNGLLVRIVQLFKIHRNVCFANNAHFCPPQHSDYHLGRRSA